MNRTLPIANCGIVFALLCCAAAAGAQEPSAQEILRAARINQSEQQRELTGRLRNEGKIIPFRLVMDRGQIRYIFSNPPQTIVLRLEENSSRLEEITDGGAKRVSAARFDAPVRDTDITYEDLSLRFLYWQKAKVMGEETILTRRCWKVHIEPPSRSQSQYSVVRLWVEQESGAFLRADCYDWDLQLSKRFEVRSVQRGEEGWILKQMRIQQMAGHRGRDRSPTYLEIQK